MPEGKLHPPQATVESSPNGFSQAVPHHIIILESATNILADELNAVRTIQGETPRNNTEVLSIGAPTELPRHVSEIQNPKRNLEEDFGSSPNIYNRYESPFRMGTTVHGSFVPKKIPERIILQISTSFIFQRKARSSQ